MSDQDGPLASAVMRLQGSIDMLRTELVRKDVYEAERAADRAEVDTLRNGVAEIKATLSWVSRTIVASLVIPIVTSAIVVYVIQQGAR